MSTSILVGATGFEGTNLRSLRSFDAYASSTNILDFEGKCFDEMIVAAGDARKWFANKNPERDREHIEKLIEGVGKIKTEKLTLFSTVDVYSEARGSEADLSGRVSRDPYGKHRYYLEQRLAEIFQKVRIVRLPGLFGLGLKKNLIFDLLCNRSLDSINLASSYQWFDLSNLDYILEVVERHDIDVINICSHPLTVEGLLRLFEIPPPVETNNSVPLVQYNITSEHAPLFGGSEYLFTLEHTINTLKEFIAAYRGQ